MPEIAMDGSKRVSTVSTLKSPVLTRRPEPPFALTLAKSPMNACVSFVITGTATEAPTAAVPPPEKLPAITSRSSFSSAATRTLPPAAIEAPSSAFRPSATYAFVVIE